MRLRKQPSNKNKVARCVCRECKYWTGSPYAKDGTCTHMPAHGRTIAEGFCYWAEKRKED